MPEKIGRIICEISDFCFPLRHQTKTLTMEKARFKVILSAEAEAFLRTLKEKVRNKIIGNFRKASYSLDPKLFKKLEGSEIWEFRALYGGVQYRMLAFWDKTNMSYTLVVATHGFIKKTQKTPLKEIAKAERIRARYFELKTD